MTQLLEKLRDLSDTMDDCAEEMFEEFSENPSFEPRGCQLVKGANTIRHWVQEYEFILLSGIENENEVGS